MNAITAAKSISNCKYGIMKQCKKDFKAILDISDTHYEVFNQLLIDYILHQIYEQVLYKKNVSEVSLDILPIGNVTLKISEQDGEYIVEPQKFTFDADFVSQIINTIECPKSKIYTMSYDNVIKEVVRRLKEFSGGIS